MFCTSHPGAWTPRRKAALMEPDKPTQVRRGSRNGKGSVPFSPSSDLLGSSTMQELSYLWSGLMINVKYRIQNCCETASVQFSRSVVSDSCDPMDCSPPASSVHGDSPGKNAGVGSLSLPQGIFPTQGSNPGLLHCKLILYHPSHQGSPGIPEWVACPFPRRSSQPRN